MVQCLSQKPRARCEMAGPSVAGCGLRVAVVVAVLLLALDHVASSGVWLCVVAGFFFHKEHKTQLNTLL